MNRFFPPGALSLYFHSLFASLFYIYFFFNSRCQGNFLYSVLMQLLVLLCKVMRVVIAKVTISASCLAAATKIKKYIKNKGNTKSMPQNGCNKHAAQKPSQSQRQSQVMNGKVKMAEPKPKPNAQKLAKRKTRKFHCQSSTAAPKIFIIRKIQLQIDRERKKEIKEISSDFSFLQ